MADAGAKRGETGWGQRGTAGISFPKSLSFEHVSFSVGRLTILKDITLEVAAGEVLALLGPSGCGKTTLLRIAAGVERPAQGSIRLDGREIAGPNVWTEPEKRGIGLVFQDYALFPHMTNLDNVMFGLADLPASEARTIAYRTLGRVGLADLAGDYPHMLSGGEQQRVALARAIAPRPGVLLMDEPFSNLDRRMRETVRQETMTLLREVRATAIIVTHDPEEAMAVADRIALMRQGEIVQHGLAVDLYRRPKNLFAARFFCDFNEIPGIVRAGHAACAFGSFPAPGLAEGLKAVICLRPQGLTLRQGGAGLAARVIARKFLGESDILTLAVEGIDHHMRARVRGGQGPEPGRDVRVEVDKDEVLVFPDAKA